MNITTFGQLLKQAFDDWNEDKAPRLAAAVAFYAMSSLAPLLIIVIAVAGLVFDREQVRGQVISQVTGLVGASGAEAIDAMLRGAEPSTGIVATVLGILTLLLAAGGLVGQLQDALNTIWEVQPKPGRGFLTIIKERFISFAMVLAVGFLLLVSLVLSTVLSALGGYLVGAQYAETLLWQIVNVVVSFAVTTLLFGLMFKYLPDAKIKWGDVWIGALMTALLFTIGRILIGLYLGRAATDSAYGAAGSLVIVLIWIYYSAQILFFGAEFTQVYARHRGAEIAPAENAERVTEAARAQQGMPAKQPATPARPQRDPSP